MSVHNIFHIFPLGKNLVSKPTNEMEASKTGRNIPTRCQNRQGNENVTVPSSGHTGPVSRPNSTVIKWEHATCRPGDGNAKTVCGSHPTAIQLDHAHCCYRDSSTVWRITVVSNASALYDLQPTSYLNSTDRKLLSSTNCVRNSCFPTLSSWAWHSPLDLD